MNKLLQWLGFSARKKIPTQSTVASLSTNVQMTDALASVHPVTQYVDVAAATKVMAILEKQLGEVSSDVESSVVGVCQGFQGMTERAQSAINLAQGAVGIDEHGKEGDLIQQMQRVMESLLENVRLSSDFSQEVSQKLLHLEARLNLVENTIEEVEEISNRAKLVALNGQIEASRLGTQGSAFQVVAEETKALASNAAKKAKPTPLAARRAPEGMPGTAAPTHNVTGVTKKSFGRDARSWSHGWELPALEGGEKGKEIPPDARYKPGSGGQLIGFVPSLDLVLTRQTGKSGEWAYEDYVRRAAAAVLPKQGAQ